MDVFKFRVADAGRLLIAVIVGCLVWTVAIVAVIELTRGMAAAGELSWVVTAGGLAALVLFMVVLFRQQSPLCEFRLSEEGIHLRFLTRAFGFKRAPRLVTWDELESYSCEVDNAGDLLTFNLRGQKPLKLAHSRYLEGQDDLDRFKARLEHYVTTRNARPAGEGAGPAIVAAKGFYGSTTAKVFAVLIGISLVALPIIIVVLEEPLTGYIGFRLLIIYGIGIPFVLRVVTSSS